MHLFRKSYRRRDAVSLNYGGEIIASNKVNQIIADVIESKKERKFVETVEVAINLRDVDLQNPQKRINAEVALPHGRGRPARVAVFAQGETAVISKKIEKYRGKLQSLLTQREHAQYQLKTIVSLEPKLTDLQTKLTQQKEDLLIYDELTAAFGKNGVQALMIERAVPLIEENANDLLSKLTNNKMTLELELQEGRVDRLTGLPSEELVINISDDTGTRSYESFSGGETFRIDFAIRIALSKLLATRSGAPLPILFIDEGFGSQDSEGQERLTEAIQSIQNQFDKIIVITHIDQMKENFEERIEVVKEATGSTFSLV